MELQLHFDLIVLRHCLSQHRSLTGTWTPKLLHVARSVLVSNRKYSVNKYPTEQVVHPLMRFSIKLLLKRWLQHLLYLLFPQLFQLKRKLLVKNRKTLRHTPSTLIMACRNFRSSICKLQRRLTLHLKYPSQKYSQLRALT